ncbi:outer membrane beta-barrel protein, partial [Rhodopirellula bahusiensis]
GFSAGLTDDLTLTYATTIGTFGEDNAGGVEKGYMHSLVADYAVSDNLQYIIQSDLLDTEDAAGATVRDTFGINQYLVYSVNDCLSLGGRFEWYQSEGVFDDGNNVDSDVYALTTGINYRPHANVLIRPEVRWDWVDGDYTGILENNDDDQTTFGFDTIFTF